MTNRETKPVMSAPRALHPDELEDVFAAVRAFEADQAEPASSALMSRILADALALQPQAMPATRQVRQGVRGSLGGWFGLGGLAIAGITGLMIGLAAPGGLDAGLGSGLGALSPELSAEIMFDPMEAFDVSLLLEESGT